MREYFDPSLLHVGGGELAESPLSASLPADPGRLGLGDAVD